MRIIEGRNRYLTEIIFYIGERVTLKTDEINWRFQ